MIKRSSLAVLLSLGLTLGAVVTTTPTVANTQYNQSHNKYQLVINEELQAGSKIKMEDGITYIPLNNIVDAVGARVEWIQETKSAIVLKENTKIQIIADNNRAKIGDHWLEFKGTPFLDKGELYVPLSFVEELNFSVVWDKSPHQLKITTSEETYEEKAQVGNWGRWGPDDERGAMNLITPEKVKEAASLIKEGKSYNLGRLVDKNVGGFGDRSFSLKITHSHENEVLGDNSVTWFDDYIEGTLQWGTQIDGINHIGVGPIYYNGFDAREYYKKADAESNVIWEGTEKLGIENIGEIFTRGVLLDIAAIRGVEMMEEGDEITVEDIQAALVAQDVDIKPGDAVILHTGWGSIWKTDNQRFNAAEPGIGSEAALWLAKQDVALIGSDTWALEVLPNPSEPHSSFPVHQILLLEHGIHILENIVTEELAADEVYEFAFIVTPLEIQGATASNISPAAYR